MPDAYVGIDPGKLGSMCVFEPQSWQASFFDWPRNGNILELHRNICDFLDSRSVRMCVLEKVHSMPGQGVSSTFQFGVNFGIWQGWLCSWRFPHEFVTPQAWMKGIVSKKGGISTKDQVCSAALRLFPEAALTGPKGGYLDGRGDALMMAYYAYRLNKE